MAKHILYPPRKQRTRAHVLADLSANHVEKCALQCGFAVERIRSDYGLDLAVFTFDRHGYRESGVLWMQLKATDQIQRSRDGKSVLVRLERRDILSWIREAYPVILVMYDAPSGVAYWLSILGQFAGKSVFAKLHGKTATVAIPASNVLDETTMRDFADLKASILEPEE